jgi:hypothetical protein
MGEPQITQIFLVFSSRPFACLQGLHLKEKELQRHKKMTQASLICDAKITIIKRFPGTVTKK